MWKPEVKWDKRDGCDTVTLKIRDKKFIFPCLSNLSILEDCSGPENRQMEKVL